MNRLPVEKKKLTTQCQAILDAVNKYGCIHLSQLQAFVPAYLSLREDYVRSMSNFLNSNHIAKMKEDCLLKSGISEPDYEMIDTIWVALDILKDESNIYNSLRTAFKPDFPRTMCLFANNSYRYDIIPLFSKSDFSKIYEENTRVSGLEQNESGLMIEHILLIRDIELVKELYTTAPIFSYRIAYLEGEYGEKPTITYYEVEEE